MGFKRWWLWVGGAVERWSSGGFLGSHVAVKLKIGGFERTGRNGKVCLYTCKLLQARAYYRFLSDFGNVNFVYDTKIISVG